MRTSYLIYERRFGVVDVYTREVTLQAMKVSERNATVVTVLLYFGSRWQWLVSHTPLALHLVKGHHYTLNRIGRTHSQHEEYFLPLSELFMDQQIHRNERHDAKIWISQAGKSKAIHRFVNTKQNFMKDDAAIYCKRNVNTLIANGVSL